MPATRQRPLQTWEVVARATVVVVPLLAFRAFSLPGIFSLAMIVPLVVLVIAYFRTPGLPVPAPELGLLALLSVSVLWGDIPDYSAERLRTYVPLTLSLVAACAMLPAETILRCLKVAIAIIVASAVLFIAMHPDSAFRSTGASGVLSAQFSKNTLGGLLGIALILALDSWRVINWLVVPSLLIMVVLNRTVTGWVVVSFLLAATWLSRWLVRKLGPKAANPFIALLAIAGLGGVLVLLTTDADSAIEALGKDPTLGNRTKIWAACWIEIKRAPLLGHGAFSFLDAASNSPVTQFVWSRFQGYHPPHPHNGLLDLLGQLGVIGVLLFSLMIASGVRNGARAAAHGSTPGRLAVILLLFIVFFGITEPTYLGEWLTITLICVAIARSSMTHSDPRANGAVARAPTNQGANCASQSN